MSDECDDEDVAARVEIVTAWVEEVIERKLVELLGPLERRLEKLEKGHL